VWWNAHEKAIKMLETAGIYRKYLSNFIYSDTLCIIVGAKNQLSNSKIRRSTNGTLRPKIQTSFG
jgi:hypothetical protein